MSAALPSWGYSYGYTYSNPYYVASAMPAYDYSQPIVINTYSSPSADAAAEASPDQAATAQAGQPDPSVAAAYDLFDQARQAFQRGEYRRALTLDEQAIKSIPDDPILHEFGALCLFALGDYARSAAVLNALLAVAPGMDWTTMSGLYPDVEVYTQQLRRLEDHVRDQSEDAPARFVLAYHYLVAGHTDAAIEQLNAVVEQQPGDRVARQILEALTPDPEPAEPPPPPPAGADAEAGRAAATEAASPTTDLVGQWRAERGGDRFELVIDDQGQFRWQATAEGEQPVVISGQTAATSDTLVLESQDQGTMTARVRSRGPDTFQFLVVGSPPDDEGLTFRRTDPDGNTDA